MDERMPTVLPVLVVLPQKAEAVPWLRAGFDDVLRLPTAKAELIASTSNREQALRAGFAAHITKPIEQPTLIQALDGITGQG
jgi:CheY-like chemotaxis protein